MDSENIKDIILQLQIMSKNILKIAKNENNPLTVWIPILTTLFMGFIAIFLDKIKYCLFKPKPKAIFREPKLITNSGNNKPPKYDFLFGIKNIGKSTLEDCEALVAEIWKLNGGGEELINLPFNLGVKNIGGITIRKIPSNGCKFFVFGEIIKPEPKPDESNFATYPSPTNIELTFTAGEGIQPLKSNGEYKIIIEISGNNINPSLKTYKLTLKDRWADNPDNIQEMVSIEEC